MGCAGKERFTTFALAERVAHLSATRHSGLKIQAYRCRDCGAYHVGSSIGPGKRKSARGYYALLDETA